MFDKIAALLSALVTLATVEEGFFSSRRPAYICVVEADGGSDVLYGPIFSPFPCLPSHWNIHEKFQCPRKHCAFAKIWCPRCPRTWHCPVLKTPKATSLSQRDMDRITDRLCGRTVNPCIWSCRSASRGFIIKDEHFKVEGLRRNSPGLEAHVAGFALHSPSEGGTRVK
jgi:hypothetical protein